jgi:hypothetical protein
MMIEAWDLHADGIRRRMETLALGTLEPRARVPAGCSLSAARRKGAALLRAA